MPPAGPPGGREIYVEFLVQGAYCKATAIDPVTGTEASVVGPSGAAQQPALADAAVRKLKYVLGKKSGGA
jgi:hypothetical protein